MELHQPNPKATDLQSVPLLSTEYFPMCDSRLDCHTIITQLRPIQVFTTLRRFSAGIVILREDFRYSHIIRKLPGRIGRARIELAYQAHYSHGDLHSFSGAISSPGSTIKLPPKKQSRKESNLPYYTSLCGFVLRLLLSHRAVLCIFQHFTHTLSKGRNPVWCLVM